MDLARHTELGLSTITYIVDELLREDCSGKREWGIEWRAPAHALEFNGAVAAVIGIKIEPTRILFSSMDLMGRIRRRLPSRCPGRQIAES